MKISHKIAFEFDLALEQEQSITFVRDVVTSLDKASFIEDLYVFNEESLGHDYVRANIPINAAMFGQHKLGFQSLLVPTPKGARLQALPFETPKTGWAEVAGEAEVAPLPQGSKVLYHFDITIYLTLPKPEKWGGRALMKMIEYTAQQMLERIAAEFPKAVQTAASEFESRHAASQMQ